MSSIRVRLIFERPLVKSPEQCWMLVDKNSCKLVRDLEYLIVKKFFVAGHTILNLYLDDFLLPSQEKIDIIRDNDVIRVIEDKNQILNNEKSRKASNKEKIGPSKKRKYDECSDSKRNIKKAKHSYNINITDENNMDNSVTEKQSSLNVTLTKSGSKNPKNSLVNNTHKEKHKNIENTAGNNFVPKGNSNTETKAKQKKFKKRQKKPSKGKDKSISVKLNNFWDKLAGSHQQWNPTFTTKKGSEKESTATVTSGPVTVDKEGVQNQTVGKVQENNEGLLSKGNVDKETPNRSKNGSPQASQGNHIRFDNEENELPDIPNNAMLPLAHPRVLSIRETETSAPNGMPLNLSPIEPNNIQIGFSANKPVNGDNMVNKPRRGKGENRKDSYTNKSLVLESTRVGKDGQTQDSQPATINIPEEDFSKYPLLHGPPRVGDTVAYKMIELSQSYTPEISRYKEGKVLSFDSLSKQLTLKLTKESLARVKGDGRVSAKFEIFENNEEDGQATATEEISDEVEIQWTSMIEPRLVVS